VSHAFHDGVALLRAADAAEREGRRREAFALRDAANDQLAVSADIRRAFARGQLSAIRADVAHYVEGCEREAEICEDHAWRLRAVEHYRHTAQLSTDAATRLRSQAADCRLWLEATS
jgi:hypothetical protein